MPLRLLALTALFCLTWLGAGCGQRVSAEKRLLAAADAIERREYDAAALELNNILHTEPGNARARLLLARVSLASGRAQVAERQVRAARRLDSSHDETDPLLARALLAQGKFETLLTETENARLNAEMLALRGLAFLHLGMPTRAIENFRQSLARAPGLTVSRIGIAQVAQAQGDGTLAEGLLHAVIDDDPFDIAAHHALGALYYAQDRLAEAERGFNDALALPVTLDNINAWLLSHVGLVETQWRVGKRARALLGTRELLERFPSHPLPKYARALLAYHDRDYKLAGEYLRQVLRAVPGHMPSKQLSAAADFALGRLGSAQINLDDVSRDDATQSGMAKLLADVYLRMGNNRDAVETLAPVIAEDADADTLDLYATANLYNGDLDTAHHFMGRALLEGRATAGQEIRYAAVLLNAGRIAQADALMSGWAPAPQTENARALLRLLRFLRSGDLERAEAYAKRRRRDNPRDLHALLTLAEAAEMRGLRDQAVGWLEVARERNPDAVEPRFLLANYARRRGDMQELMSIAEEILAVQPFNADALSLLGNVYLSTGDSAAAIGTLREALRVSPLSPRTAIDLARAQLATGDFWQARLTIRETLARQVPLKRLTGVIVEEYQRGNDEQARALATELQEFDASNPVGYSVEGDLYMLEGEFDKALDAYRIAQSKGADRSVAVKAFAAAAATGADDPAQPLSEWLKTAPGDRQIRRVMNALN